VGCAHPCEHFAEPVTHWQRGSHDRRKAAVAARTKPLRRGIFRRIAIIKTRRNESQMPMARGKKMRPASLFEKNFFRQFLPFP
jgi:hypothetical protein